MKLVPTTITHKSGGLEQAILEAVNQDGLLNNHDKKRLEYLKSLPQNRIELLNSDTTDEPSAATEAK